MRRLLFMYFSSVLFLSMGNVVPDDGLCRRFLNSHLYDLRLSEVATYVSLKHARLLFAWLLPSLSLLHFMLVVLLLLYS